MANKRVEVAVITIEYIENSSTTPCFEDIISYCIPQISGNTEIKLISSSIENCIVGIVEKVQERNIAPIKDKVSGETNPLDIDVSREGPAFANIFLYSKASKIFLYEINKNGMFLSRFIEAMTSIWNNGHQSEPIKIHSCQLLRKDEYERLSRFSRFSSFEIELTNPRELYRELSSRNDTLSRAIKNYLNENNLDSNIIKIKQSVFNKRVQSQHLNESAIREFIEINRTMLSAEARSNIRELKFSGYYQDSDDEKMSTEVDLVGDTFKLFLKLQDRILISDFQTNERKSEIERLYLSNLAEFQSILGR